MTLELTEEEARNLWNAFVDLDNRLTENYQLQAVYDKLKVEIMRMMHNEQNG